MGNHSVKQTGVPARAYCLSVLPRPQAPGRYTAHVLFSRRRYRAQPSAGRVAFLRYTVRFSFYQSSRYRLRNAQSKSSPFTKFRDSTAQAETDPAASLEFMVTFSADLRGLSVLHHKIKGRD